MVGLVEGALYIGSAVILYQGLTKQKVLSKKNVRNGTLGALFGLFSGPKLEEIIKNTGSLTDEQKKKILGAVAGAGLGAYAGKEIAGGVLNKPVGYVKSKFGNYTKNSDNSGK